MGKPWYPPEKLDGVEPGIYPYMSDEDYHQGPGVSSSGLKKILKTPLHFVDPYIHPERYQDLDKSPALVFGSAAHRYLLEPEVFEHEYVVSPKVNRRTTEGRFIWQAFEKKHAGKKLIGEQDMQFIEWMKEATENCDSWQDTFRNTKKEISIFWRDKESGTLCKVRPDAMKETIINGRRTMLCIDVKTAIDASYVGFSRAIHNFGYDLSAGMYAEGIRAAHPGIDDVKFLFAPIEKTPPFACAVYVLDHHDIVLGYRKFRVALTLFNQCVETNEWKSYPDYITPIQLPKWARNL